MTQEQALEELKAIFPDDKQLAVERDRTIGSRPGNSFYLWSRNPNRILGSSEISWEHALAEAKHLVNPLDPEFEYEVPA